MRLSCLVLPMAHALPTRAAAGKPALVGGQHPPGECDGRSGREAGHIGRHGVGTGRIGRAVAKINELLGR